MKGTYNQTPHNNRMKTTIFSSYPSKQFMRLFLNFYFQIYRIKCTGQVEFSSFEKNYICVKKFTKYQ